MKAEFDKETKEFLCFLNPWIRACELAGLGVDAELFQTIKLYDEYITTMAKKYSVNKDEIDRLIKDYAKESRKTVLQIASQIDARLEKQITEDDIRKAFLLPKRKDDKQCD